MSAPQKKCAHPACNCLVDQGKKYCSDYCHDSGNKIEIACNCHHAICEAPAGEPVMKAEG
jgi:hypothetical protein